MPTLLSLHRFKPALTWACLILSTALFSSASYASFSLEGIKVYPKLTAPAQTEELTRYQNSANLLTVLGSEFKLAHYENNAAVQSNIRWFMHNKNYIIKTTQRATPYLFFVLQQIKKRDLPSELVLVPMIESDYNPYTYSSTGAAGIWQLMPDTASGFSIRQDSWYDGRRDVVASTSAALDYLSYLFDVFNGNALLALAAYNAGEGRVLSAIRHNLRAGKSTDFWSLPLPKETRLYVPRILALATIIAHPERYPVKLPMVHNAPYLAQVDVGGQIELKRAASYAGLSFKRFKELNPAFNHLVTHPNGPHKLVLPIENVEQFMSHLASTSLSRHIDWATYKVKSRDSLVSIAKLFNTTPIVLQEINHLKSVHIKRGAKLIVPRTMTVLKNDNEPKTTLASKAKEAEKHATLLETALANLRSTPPAKKKVEAPAESLQPGDTVYMVRAHDTVEKIAERYHLPPDQVYAINKLHSSSIIHPGDHLLIPTRPSSKRSA